MAGKPAAGRDVTSEELKKVERYLRRLFNNSSIAVKGRPRKEDSAEVYVGEEFVGVIYRDDEDEELSYNFSMAILDYDLDD
ncbi:MAG: DUF3126 family protein [Propylenella sp.]